LHARGAELAERPKTRASGAVVCAEAAVRLRSPAVRCAPASPACSPTLPRCRESDGLQPGGAARWRGPFVPQIDEPSDDNTQMVGTLLGDGLSTARSTLLASAQFQVVAVPGLPTLTVSQKNSAITAVVDELQPCSP